MQKLTIFLCLLIPVIVTGIGLGITQSAGVKGKLICNGKPAAGVTVKLYDDDRGKATLVNSYNFFDFPLVLP